MPTTDELRPLSPADIAYHWLTPIDEAGAEAVLQRWRDGGMPDPERVLAMVPRVDR